MAETTIVPVKEILKFVTRFQKFSFGGDAQEEVLNQHTQYDEQGKLLSEMRMDEFGHEELHTYRYNDTGKLIQHNLSADDGEVSEDHRFIYDEKGRLTMQQKYYGDDPGEYTEYRYAAHDQPISIVLYDSDGELETEETILYNEKDNPIEIKRVSHTGQGDSKSVIEYDDKSLPVSKTSFDKNGKVLSVTTFSYDDKGQAIQITEKSGEGKMISDTQTTYNDHGNVVERTIRDFQPRVLRFTWDENHNCIEESVHDENGNLLQRSTYEFDDQNRPVTESHFHLDLNRGSGPANSSCRYEYISW